MAEYAHPEVLVDTTWVAEHLNDPNVRIVESNEDILLYDQGHIPAKLLGFERTAALPIGSPILFASVAHGSAHDIAGKGVANPAALIQ